MANIMTQICDGEGCRTLRVNDTNHWFVSWTKNGVASIGLMDKVDTLGLEGVKHFCGQQCATRYMVTEISKLRDK